MGCISISGLLQAVMGRGCFGGLWGSQFFGGVVNYWRRVHAGGGGAGRWAIIYGVLGLP